MLPSIQHGMESRVSLYNVIPPIGASIHNFRNRDEKLWSTLQHIREMEKTVSEQTSPRELSPIRALNYLLTVQDSNFVETSLKKAPEGNFAENEKMVNWNEECHGDLFDVPSSPSDSEVEFSIAVGNVRPLVIRYCSSDQESCDESAESLSVLGNSMPISWPHNSFKDEAVQKLEGRAAVENKRIWSTWRSKTLIQI